jgi:hypothetical protein
MLGQCTQCTVPEGALSSMCTECTVLSDLCAFLSLRQCIVHCVWCGMALRVTNHRYTCLAGYTGVAPKPQVERYDGYTYGYETDFTVRVVWGAVGIKLTVNVKVT